MERIGLIDVDGHHFPNLALMKLSAWHKSHGDQVEWWSPSSYYDMVYMSKVFSDEYTSDVPTPVNTHKIVKSGTGYAIKLEDGKEVYHKELDPPPFQTKLSIPTRITVSTLSTQDTDNRSISKPHLVS